MKKISLICVFLFSIISASIAQCFTISNSTPCAQSPVTFTVQNPGAGPYTWNFGDLSSGANNTASGVSTAHTFNTPGTYTVSLSNNGTLCVPPQTVTVGGVAPDFTFISPIAGEFANGIFSACGIGQNILVEIANSSIGSTSNTSYTINWGDGSAVQLGITNNQFIPSNTSTLQSHSYNNFGFFTITLTAIDNGCSTIKSYQVYNGTNPTVAMDNPGSTTGLCAPTTLTFPIDNNITNLNPPGTIYTITLNNSILQTYTQSNLPSSYSYPFNTSSCGSNTPSNPNSYEMRITASNPCGSSYDIVGPIQLSAPPVPDFISSTTLGCPNTSIIFTNTTPPIQQVNNQGANCVSTLPVRWTITPNSGWTTSSNLLNSTAPINVLFNTPGVYTIRMTVLGSSCGQPFIEHTVTIQTPPTALASFTTNPTNNCVPAVVTLNNTSTGTTPVTYTWSVPSNMGASFPPNSTTFSTTTTSTAPITANFTQPGTYNITLTASNVCATATWTQPVTLKTRPTVTLAPISNICGVPTTISPSATYDNGGGAISSYNWNFTGGSPSSSTLQNPSPVTYTSSGPYTISATATNECGPTTAMQSFTVTPRPSITFNTSTTPTICANSSITITASATGGNVFTYAWSNNAGSGASITVSPTSTTTYTVTVTNSAGCSASASQTVIVNPLPLATATNTGPYCLNNTISLNSSGGGTYSWSGPNGFTSNLQNPTISNAIAINTGVYTVTVTLVGCAATASTSVTVNSNPVATITANTPCVGGTLTLTPSGGTTYSWILPNGFTSTANPLVLNGVTAANAGVYSVTASNASGCTATGSTTVTINALPIPAATNTGPVCPNTSATLNGSGGGTYSWSGPNGFNATTQNPSVTLGTTNATYSLTVTNSNSCTASISTTIIVRTPPNAVASNTSPRCLGSTSAIVLNASGGATYSWSGPSSFTSSTQNPSLSTPVVSNQGGVYTLTVTDANTCTATAQTTVVVNPLPTVSAGSAQSICNTYTGTTTFVGSPAGGTWTGTGITPAGVFTIPNNTVTSYPLTYTYADNNGCTNTAVTQANVISNQAAGAGVDIAICNATPLTLVGAPVGGTWSGNGVNGNTFDPTSLNAGNYTLTYTVGSSNCQTTDTRVVTVLPLPTATISAPAVCQNQTLTLSASGSNISTYSWSGPPSFTNNTATITRPNATVAMSGTYTLTITGTNSCTNTTSVTATVNPLPTVDAGLPQSICSSSSTYQLVGYSPTTGGTGVWTGTGVNSTGGFNASLAVGNYNLTYTFTDNNGCINSDAMVMTITANQAANAGVDESICNNALPLALVGTPSGGTWSGSTGVTGASFSPLGLLPGTYTLTYTVNAGTVCQTVDTKVVTILPLPVATISAPAVCQNQTLTLNANGSNISAYSWAGPPSFTNNTATITRPNATVAMSGTYTLTITGTNSCTNTTSVTATVNPLPTVEAGLPQSICNSNSTYQLLGYSPTTGGTGIWTGTGVNAAGGFDASLAVGNYNLTYTFTDNNGCINSDVMVMTITANQAANAGVDESICNNALPLALVGTPVGGTWSGTNVTGASFNPIGLTPGTYTLTYTVNGGTVCQTVDTKIVTVLPLPQITVSSTGPYCVGGSFTLSAVAANAQSYAWGGPNSFNAAISNPVLNNLTTTMSGIYTVTVTGTNTCSATSNTPVTVNALPIVNARDSSYCLTPGLVSLPYASPVGGTWTGTAVQSNQFNPSVAGLGTFVLVYTYTNPTTQCINADNSTVSVVSPQAVNAGLDLSVCNNDPVVNLLPLGTPSGGTWSINSAGQAGLTGTNFTPSLLAPNNYTLTYTVGNGNCQVSDNMIITIRPLPSIIATGSTVCANQVIQLAVAGTGLSAYSWSGPLSFSSILQNPTRPNATSAMAGNYSVTVTGTNACQQTANATVIVNSLPIVDAGVNQTICNNNAVFTLSAFSPTSGGVGTWTGLGIVPPSGFSASQAGGVGSYTLTYTFTDLNACVNQDTISMTVTANNPPNAGAAQSVCLNTPAFSLVNGTPAGGTWSGSGIAVGSNVFNPLNAAVGQHVLTYSIGQGICLTTDTVIYTVRPLPNAIATSVGPYCVTGAFTLQASGGASYAWSGPMGFTSTLSSPVISNLTLTNSGIYTVTVTGANACSQTATTSITINPLPIILSSDTTYCNTSGLVPLPYSTPANGSWAGNGVSGLSFNPQIGVGTYNATYTYTDNSSCTDSVTVEISVIDPVSINAGANDTICIDAGLFTLTNYSPSSGGNWSGAGIINSSNGIFDPLLAGGGLHILTYTYGTGNCQVTASKTIFVVDLSATTAGIDEAFCISRPIFNLTGNNPLGGVWSGDGITNVNLGTYDPMIAGAGLDTLSYTYTDVISGCQWTDYKIINVYPLPTPNFDSLGAICVNVPYTFNNSSPNITSSLWTFGDGGTSNLTSPTHTYSNIGYYTVSLIASNIYGCVDSVSRTIFVTEPPYAHFTMDTTEGCEPLPIIFTNQSYGYGASYLWDFGNGTVDTNYTPAPVVFSAWAQDTVYHITLTVSNLCGTVVWEDSVLVHPIPLVRFSPNIDDGCSPLFVSFTNTTRGNPDTYFWDMGNGFTTTDSIPPIQYYNTDTLPRIYTVTLISGNECGFDTLRHDIVVNPVTVDAFFYADTTSGCEPLTVNFSNYSTPNTSIVWDFGDNNGSSLASPIHVFDSSGIFKVIQYVSNGCGYDSAFVYITVFPQPAVEFTHPAYVCAGLPMQFTNTSSSVIVSSWDFGDGTTSSDQNPSHIYASGGVYTVTLIGTSLGNGCPTQISHNVLIRSNPVPIFTPSSTFGCPPLNIAFNNTSQGGLFYTWDFGDGNTAITASPSHLYTVPGQYTIALEVTDNFGCKADTAMYNLFVYPIPSSSFTYTPVSLCGIPTTINFTNTSTGAIGYNWTFGNGANSILNNPTAIYTSADDFNVSLVATNQYLCSDTANAVITTYAQPQVDFLLTPDSGCQPLVVSFSDNSIDANGWEWVFGDGNSSNLPNPVHTYIDEGTYNVTLIANYSNTCFDTILVSNAVEVLPTPVADFSYVEILEPASGIINFTNESSPDANQFEWDFGDGDFSNEENPNHRYYINGNRAIMLTVMAENGCQDTIVKQITPTIFRGLFVPNAFSPEVGVGDVRLFWPKGVGLAYYHVKVYSPWGELLWQSDKLNEGIPSESWDGTYHGILMPQDVYVWECEAIFIDGSNWKGMPDKDGVYRKIGSVTLLR